MSLALEFTFGAWIQVLLYAAVTAAGFYNYFLSPIQHIAGPPLAKINVLWLTINEMMGKRSKSIHREHLRYGPVVRIGPSELSFSDPACIKELYSQSTLYMKTSRYKTFGAVNDTALFDTQDREDHREKRMMTSAAFSSKSVNEVEPLIME
ncbi:MAG: hypothetical protein M1827_002573 [Pycnora praestabilis]|nr:MAG: hypothetical protein M1827_002573 [Pycnora praestabilis]